MVLEDMYGSNRRTGRTEVQRPPENALVAPKSVMLTSLVPRDCLLPLTVIGWDVLIDASLLRAVHVT